MDTRDSGFATAGRLDAGLALLRGIIGVVFVAHGVQKFVLFGFGGMGPVFAESGVPLAAVTGPAVMLVETFAGLALLVGLFTPVAAAALAVVMAGAVLLVHLPAGFFLPNGYEFALTLLFALVALVLTGPGAWSVDAALGRRG